MTNAATTPNVPSAPPVTARGGREGQLDGPRADQIELTWGQAADRGNRIQGYKVYSAASPTGPFSDRGWKESPFLDRDLAPGQTVHYRVVAVNEVGEGVPGTATASADTYSVPSEPRNLVAASQAGETRLVWQEPAYVGPIILGNQVYRGFEDGPLALLAEVGPEPTYSDTTCPLGRVCTYEVRATNRAGTGPASAQAQAFGTALPPDSPVLTPLYESAVDPDQDGHATPDELLGNSNPLLGGSHPDEDSNCDGTDNREEGSFLAAHGIGHRALRVTPGEGVRVHPEAMDHGGDLVVVDVATVTPYTEEGQECT